LSSSPESGIPSCRGIIFGCAGLALSADERRFFAEADPYGFILFRRNIAEPAQVRALVAQLRESVGRPDAPVLVDQEGGRVARLSPPLWPALPAARKIGQLAEQDFPEGQRAALALGRVIGAMLADVGIDVACAPVADLLLPMALAEGLRDAGVLPILKHIPGHGRAIADSHLELPRIAASKGELDGHDFVAFRRAAAIPWAMVAHCAYSAFDATAPASTSPTIIGDVIRGEIAYQGVLIADDIGMKALAGSLARNAAATLAAGCDLTLHCSGEMREMIDIAPAVAPLTGDAVIRLAHARDWLRQGRRGFDPAEEMARLDRLSA
jgi:beta-N-acetylhexosaminidase